ncbi:putative PH domain-containing protein [Rosellinia necatrix]|uniref:Putative PH domain-containing protein n=1 Tax=Rosellinia necatrix TaxID=77044 RepID=A0A1W2TLL4_ROSNE|nr:putative PH domain-containing protein [Rosellinia necatrix]
MAETATHCLPQKAGTSVTDRRATVTINPTTITSPINTAVNRLRSQLALSTPSPVNQNGSFEFDRVLKSGYVQKRTQKTKVWKPVYLVLRPNALSIYKSDKESKLRHKLYLSDLSAVAPLKDPKQKRNHLFGLFSPARNFHFEAPTANDAQEWIDLIRQDARIEEEEEEMFLASPIIRRQSFAPASILKTMNRTRDPPVSDHERFLSSSPEPLDLPKPIGPRGRRSSHNDYSGLSANEVASQSDLSDVEGRRGHGASIESFTVPLTSASGMPSDPYPKRPVVGDQNVSQISGLNVERDPDRVVWQGWLWFLKGKRGMRQWKNCWAVLRPRNLILYKDGSEYTASFILALVSVVNVVDIDPVSKTKVNCMQIITDEKSYRFCAHDEESLVHCLGAFKSLLSKRKELEARVSVSG